MRGLTRLLAIFLILLVPPLPAAAVASRGAASALATSPSAALDPAEVVLAQLAALKKGSDAGIAIVFRFASPNNQSQTGPLERFVGLVRESYPALLEHRSARLIPGVIDGDTAYQGVELTAKDGSEHRYVFVLSRQSEAPCKDCWMTDGVIDQDKQKPPRKPAVEG